jgi:hypothetical protein
MFAIIAPFLLPRLPVFDVLNFTPNPVVGSIGVILCAGGMALLVWGRQHLGAKTGAAMFPFKKGMNL